MQRVQVWVKSIHAESRRRDSLRQLLTTTERERMSRFYRDPDALRFLVGRSTLRREVAALHGIAPVDVRLDVGEFGKLAVAGGPHVNVSHSGDIVIVALCDGAEIGVDVEEHDPSYATEANLSTFFSPAEIRAHDAYTGDARVASFFHIWTTKEALIKAASTGLSLPPQSSDGSGVPNQRPGPPPARCRELSGPIALEPLDVPPGYSAVLAAFAPGCEVVYRARVPG